MADDNKAQITLSAVDRTKAAFDTARRNFDSLKAAGQGMLPIFGSLGLAVTAAFEGISLKNAIDAADELSKLSQKTGIAIEDLSALKYAGDLSNVSIDDLATGIKKLGNNMAAAAGGNKEIAAVFTAIGVSATTTSGALRNTDDVLGDIADRFAGYQDGAGKAALATELFGKNGAALIPFLNAGRAGLADMKDEAEKLGIVIGGKLGKEAEAFNDNLTRMNAAVRGAKISLASELLPTLGATLEAFVRNTKAAGLFTGALLTIGEGLSQRLGLDELGQLQSKAASTSDEIGRVTNQMVGLSNILEREPGNEAARRRYETLRGTLKNLQGQAQQTGDAIKALANTQTASVKVPDEPGTAPPPIVQKGVDASAANALATLKKNLDGRLQAIQQNLGQEQDLLKFNETFTQAVYNNGNTSLAAFYQVQDALRQRNLEEQKQALNDSIAAELAYQAKLSKDDTGNAARAESQNKIAAARAKIAAAEREALQAADLSKVERPAALDAQQRQVDAFNAAMQDIIDGGRTRAAELADIAARVEAARQVLVKGGADDASVQAQTSALRAQLTLQHDFNVARDEFARITDRAGAAEEALALVQKSSGAGLLESEQQIHALREQELAQLGKLLDTTRALASVNPQNDALQKSLRDLELAYGRLKEAADPTKLRLDGAAATIGDALANGLNRANTEGKNLKQILGGIGTQIADIVEREVITKPLSQSIANFVKGAGGQGAGENLIGKLFGLNSPKSSAIAADPTAQLSASLTALQASGVDPATEALARLQQAADGASGALGGATSGTPGFGPAGGYEFGGTNTTGEQSIKQLFKNVDEAQSGASKSTDALGKATGATELALTRLAASAGQGGSALSLLPQIVSLISSAATSISAAGGASAGGGGLFGWLGSLFGGGTTSGGMGSYVSGATGSASTVGMSLHSGGIVGTAGTRVTIDAGASQYAARYHGGGIAGLKPDEVPAVLMGGPKGKREEVLHASDPRHSDNGGMRRSGDTYQSFDMRGLTVDSHGAMDRMAEERAARNIARKAQTYLSRRGS
ncbi:MAG: hypothetical protein ACSLE9_00765 [Burkholderiaceae bacterium]